MGFDVRAAMGASMAGLIQQVVFNIPSDPFPFLDLFPYDISPFLCKCGHIIPASCLFLVVFEPLIQVLVPFHHVMHRGAVRQFFAKHLLQLVARPAASKDPEC